MDKATSFSQLAHEAFGEMVFAQKVVGADVDYKTQERAWKLFLREYRKFIRHAGEAAKHLGRKNWADNLEKERKESDCLTYCYQARNAEEHGLEKGFQGHPSALSIGNMLSFSGACNNITIVNCTEITTGPSGEKIERRVDGQFSTIDGRVANGWLNSEVPVARRLPYLQLKPVTNRGKSYSLPTLDVNYEDLGSRLITNK